MMEQSGESSILPRRMIAEGDLLTHILVNKTETETEWMMNPVDRRIWPFHRERGDLNLMLKTQDGLTVGNVLRGLNILDQGRGSLWAARLLNPAFISSTRGK